MPATSAEVVIGGTTLEPDAYVLVVVYFGDDHARRATSDPVTLSVVKKV